MVRVTIIFRTFAAANGEQVAIVGNCPELGNWTPTERKPLEHKGNNLWQTEIPIQMVETDQGELQVSQGNNLSFSLVVLKAGGVTPLPPDDEQHKVSLNVSRGRWFEIEIVKGVEYKLTPNGMERHFQRLPDTSKLEDVKDFIEKFEWKRKSEPWLEAVHLVALACLHTHPEVADLLKSLELLEEAEQLQQEPVSATYLIKTARLKILALQSCDGFPEDWHSKVDELEDLWNQADSSSSAHGAIGWILLRCGFDKSSDAEGFFAQANQKEPENFYWQFGLAVTKARIRRSRNNRSKCEDKERNLWESAENKLNHEDMKPLFFASYAEAILNDYHQKAKELIAGACSLIDKEQDDPESLPVLIIVFKVCRILWKKFKVAEDQTDIKETAKKAYNLAKLISRTADSKNWYEKTDLNEQMAMYCWKLTKDIPAARKHFKKAGEDRNLWVAKHLIDLDQNPDDLEGGQKPTDKHIQWICQRSDSLCLRDRREAHKAHILAEKGCFLAVNDCIAEGVKCIAWALNEYARDEVPNVKSALDYGKKKRLEDALNPNNDADARFILAFVKYAKSKQDDAAANAAIGAYKRDPNHQLSIEQLGIRLLDLKDFDEAIQQFKLLSENLAHKRELIADCILKELEVKWKDLSFQDSYNKLAECLQLGCKHAGELVLKFLEEKTRKKASADGSKPLLHQKAQYELAARLLNLLQNRNAFFIKRRLQYKNKSMQPSYAKAKQEADEEFKTVCKNVKTVLALDKYPRKALLRATQHHLTADREQEKDFSSRQWRTRTRPSTTLGNILL